VSPPVAAMIKDWPPRIEYARAAALPGRSGRRIKIQDHQVMMILIYLRPTSFTTRRDISGSTV